MHKSAHHKARRRSPLQVLVQDYGWIHLFLGWLGNGAFFAGSVLFLQQADPYKTVAMWLFVSGSFLMWVGSSGRVLVSVWEKD